MNLSLKTAISTLHQSRKIIACVTIAWVLLMIAGAVFNESMKPIQDFATEQTKAKLKLIPHTFLGFFSGILINNALISASMIVGGFFIIVPLFQGFLNSFFAGAIIYNYREIIPVALPYIFFEFSALILACSLGVYVAKGWLTKPREVWDRIWRSLGVFLWVILPLLIVAALIESVLIMGVV